MQFERKIYYFNWRKLIRWLTPQPLRKPRFLAFLRGFVSGVQYSHAAFIDFKISTEYTLTITPQVCYLEKMLNDRFDFLQRRIYITDGANVAALWLALDIEDKSLWLALDAENEPLWLPVDNELSIFGGDFTIVIPADVVYDADELAARVNMYKLASKQWNIQIKKKKKKNEYT
jgi:hypothetical protein